MSSISFNNASISAPVVGKPHIAMSEGYWRVSRWVKGSRSLFYHAHYFINQRNYKISAGEEAGVANTVESLPHSLPQGVTKPVVDGTLLTN